MLAILSSFVFAIVSFHAHICDALLSLPQFWVPKQARNFHGIFCDALLFQHHSPLLWNSIYILLIMNSLAAHVDTNLTVFVFFSLRNTNSKLQDSFLLFRVHAIIVMFQLSLDWQPVFSPWLFHVSSISRTK